MMNPTSNQHCPRSNLYTSAHPSNPFKSGPDAAFPSRTRIRQAPLFGIGTLIADRDEGGRQSARLAASGGEVEGTRSQATRQSADSHTMNPDPGLPQRS